MTYFISNGVSVKIGRSNHVSRRLRELQTSSSRPLRLLLVLEGDHEREFHRRLAGYREGGEWFTLSPSLGVIFETALQFFSDWLSYQCERDHPIGDLARDVRGDKRFPLRNNDYERLLWYLLSQQFSCHEVIITYALAYREWLRSRRTAGVVTGFVGRCARNRNKAGPWVTANRESIERIRRSEL